MRLQAWLFLVIGFAIGFGGLYTWTKQRAPDVVLLDIGLPRLNGYEAARRIRQQSWGRDTVLIAVTGWGQEEDRRRSKEAGFDDHMVKPFEPTALEELLTKFCPTST